ncbi:MAG: dynamin family protein [Candidatus Muirbacterium halophilum]|nr:dynamin family protein [Candidatus Muirbacterium halophilum]MCK9474471.1 dynamin family protein [Candidatus Muirbacterium halophilum]
MLKEYSNKLDFVFTELPELKEYEKNWKEKEDNIKFNICMIGEYSSGKTSLINCLLNKEDFLPIGDEPTTNSVVKVNPNKENLNVWVEIDNEKQNINLDQVSEVITGKSNLKTGKVNIDIADSPFYGENYVIYDTPGLSSLVKEHGKLLDFILPEIDIVILVVDIERGGISGSLLNYLKENLIKKHKLKDFMVVINKCDLKIASDVEKVVEEINRNLKSISVDFNLLNFSCHNYFESKNKKDIDLKYSDINSLITFINNTLLNPQKILFERKIKIRKNILNDIVEEVENLIRFKEEIINSPISSNEDFNKLLIHKNSEIVKLQKEMEDFRNKIHNSIDKINDELKNWLNSNLKDIVEEIVERDKSSIENRFKELEMKVKKGVKELEDICANLQIGIESNVVKQKMVKTLDKIMVKLENIIKVVDAILIAILVPTGGGGVEFVLKNFVEALAGKKLADLSEKAEDRIAKERSENNENIENTSNKNVWINGIEILSKIAHTFDIPRDITYFLAKKTILLDKGREVLYQCIHEISGEIVSNVDVETKKIFDDFKKDISIIKGSINEKYTDFNKEIENYKNSVKKYKTVLNEINIVEE